MSAVGVISTTALPSPVSTSSIPSHCHAGDTTSVGLLTTLTLRNRHARGRRTRDQPVAVVEDVRLAEEEGLPHLDHAAHGSQPALHRRTGGADLELDCGVPHAVFLKGGEGHPHRGVCDLGD